MRLLLATAALLTATSASAVTFVNGNFSQSPTVSVKSTSVSLPGWVTLSSGVIRYGNGVLLSAQNFGGIMQTLGGFDPGKHYRITFDVSGDSGGSGKANRLLVSATGGEAQIYTFGASPNARVATLSSLSSLSYDFVASGKFQDVQFRSLGKNSFGTVLANVEISLVPEPAVWGLMLAGFGLIGGLSRRRARARSMVA